MKTPVLSLFCAGNRPALWTTVYESVLKNSISFEIIFVGDKKPSFKLPKNVKYIYSEVKPAQCFHIAVSEAQGKYLLNIPDDFLYSPGSLDRMVSVFETKDHMNTIVSAKYCRNQRFFSSRPDTPWMPVGTLCSRELWDDLGGIDNRFVCLYWDMDIAMRLISRGGQNIIPPKAFVDDKKIHKLKLFQIKEQLCEYNHNEDRDFVYSLWCEKSDKPWNQRKLLSARSDPNIIPYENNESLLIRSQGNKGKWK